jgi:hypothetical protein
MQESPISRIKCAMIVYELERALGRFCRERGDGLHTSPTAKNIISRSPEEFPAETGNITQFIVENSYLGEVLALAQAAARGTSSASRLAELERLLSAVGVFDIRNAISHPNRPFPEFYWYRCAAVASDPSIDALGFFEVSLAFQNAIDGKLAEPPENWMHKKRWSLPTSLPEEFEHSVTGLFGRYKDSARLEKEIKNPRSPLISIVAKGGVGKTSLMLEVASDLCLSSDATKYVDGLLWASLKQERLTSTGIELLDAPSSLVELEEILCAEAGDIFGQEFHNFEEAKDFLQGKRILLCLDNLETILRDHPLAFNDFYESLPSTWKVIVTSRISVESAKNIPLEDLDKQGATALARAYLQSKGVQSVDSDLISEIAIGCKFNPLAIRLAIELYISGADVHEALQRTEQEVISFSFKNLLDTLSQLQNDILEVIFVLEDPNRIQLCGALESNADDVSEAVAGLSKMSLISRIPVESGEKYTLGSSIRDLLRIYPRNLGIRSKTVLWLAKSKSSKDEAIRLQLERNVSPVDIGYIPEYASAEQIAMHKQIKSAIKNENRSALVTLEGRLRQQLTSEATSSFLHRLYGWITSELDDAASAITHFQRASAIDSEDPSPLFGLMQIRISQQNWVEVGSVSRQLIDAGWGEPIRSQNYYANRIWASYLQAENIASRFDEVFAQTVDWQNRIRELPSWSVGRAAAYRRLADSECRRHACDDARLGQLLSKASRLLMKVIVGEGFAKWILPEVKKLGSELVYYHGRGFNFQAFKAEDLSAILSFLESYLREKPLLGNAGTTDVEISNLLAACGRTPKSDGSLQAMQGSVATPPSNREKFEDGSFVFAKLKNGTKNNTNYVFAQDEHGVDYFVHMDVFEDGNWANRHLLVADVELALRYEQNSSGNALRAIEAWLIQ